jgi:ActR/RegA family two-component response regulator
MIEHAFVNILQNAIHATSLTRHPVICIHIFYCHPNICFEIEDNGCGIPDKHLKHIYDPAFTLKGSRDRTGSYKTDIKGTGYGLSNVKKYIELHNGGICIESEFKIGTKITLRLPVIKKELTEQEKIQIRKGIPHTGKHILLVEDETALSEIQYKVLTQEPCCHSVDIADTGQGAMDLFDRNDYDFISLDYILKGVINGMDVYHHIRESDPTVPILFMSGNFEFLESVRALKKKDSHLDHLSKPCQNKMYVDCINDMLEWAEQSFKIQETP